MKISTRLFIVSLAVSGLALVPGLAHAQLVYSNFPYRPDTGFGLPGAGNASYVGYAAKFNTGGFTGFMSSLMVSFGNVSSNTLGASAYLLADNGLGTSPATVLANLGSVSIPNTGSTTSYVLLPFTFPVTTSVPLAASTNYWIGIEKAGASGDFPVLGITTDMTPINNTNAYSEASINGPWTVFNNGNKTAFEVNGSAVAPGGATAPEPGTLVLLALGGVGALVARRRF
jgi:PEP-CTERM motif